MSEEFLGVDITPDIRLAQTVQRARLIYHALAKISPLFKKFDFRSADELAGEILIEEKPFIEFSEYHSARHDFENLAKIKNLLDDYNFRTAKVDFDLREVGLGGYASEELYQTMKDTAIKAAVPVLKSAIISRDYQKAEKIATELIKTNENHFDTEYYDFLVNLLRPEFHFITGEECYYVPANHNLDQEDSSADIKDAFEVLPEIASSDNCLEKTLAVLWLLDVQALDYLSYFADDEFTKSDWFDHLLKKSVNLPESDNHYYIKALLIDRQPGLARKIFDFADSPKLSEEEYFDIVSEVAERIKQEEIDRAKKSENQVVSDENEAVDIEDIETKPENDSLSEEAYDDDLI